MIIKGIKDINDQEEAIDFIVKNLDEIYYGAKYMIKEGDSPDFSPELLMDDLEADKADFIPDNKELGIIQRRLIINTTNLMDNHDDVHIPKLFDRSLKSNSKRMRHYNQHRKMFEEIISDKDDLHAFMKTFSWKSLGYDVEGKTQALTFDSTIKRKRHSRMYKEYDDGNVDNHSVGMQYVKMAFAANSKKAGHEVFLANWEKYRPMVVNGERADKKGFFHAVLEAKAIEGSAVVDGSNSITPTLVRTKAPIILEPQIIADKSALSVFRKGFINHLNN